MRALVVVATAAVVLAAVAAAGTAVARADAAVEATGWWWRAQTGVLAPLPSPASVPEDGLYVAGLPDGPVAVAAVRFALSGRNPVLTLEVAEDRGGEQAVLLACGADRPWIPTRAGMWSARPDSDCSTAVEGVRAQDGATWTFALTPLVRDGRLDVVLLPGVASQAPPGADGSSFELSFQQVTSESLATTGTVGAPGPSGALPAGSSTPFIPPSYGVPGATPAAGADGISPGWQPGTAVPQPAAAGAPAPEAPLAAPPERQRATLPQVDTAVPASASAGQSLGVVVALAVFAVVYLLSRQPAPAPPRVAQRAGASQRHPQVAPPQVGGIGRFARPRTGPAPRL